jgi:hypothetical protein
MSALFTEVLKLLRIYLVIPITSASAERAFSALKFIKSLKRANMGQKRLNHLVFLHIHKALTMAIDPDEIVKEFVLANPRRLDQFGAT